MSNSCSKSYEFYIDVFSDDDNIENIIQNLTDISSANIFIFLQGEYLLKYLSISNEKGLFDSKEYNHIIWNINTESFVFLDNLKYSFYIPTSYSLLRDEMEYNKENNVHLSCEQLLNRQFTSYFFIQEEHILDFSMVYLLYLSLLLFYIFIMVHMNLKIYGKNLLKFLISNYNLLLQIYYLILFIYNI